MADPIFVYEFLYRGQTASSPNQPAWHIVMGQFPGNDSFGNAQPITRSSVMNMTQAEAAGYSLPTIIATINAALTTQVEALEAQVAALNQQLQDITDGAKQ